MSLFHANVQIRNDSARTLYITMLLVTVVDEEEEESSLLHTAALVPPHTLEPGYSHLYSIPPPQHQRARVTLAFRDSANDNSDSAVWLSSVLQRQLGKGSEPVPQGGHGPPLCSESSGRSPAQRQSARRVRGRASPPGGGMPPP
jgi:hypothetical protein